MNDKFEELKPCPFCGNKDIIIQETVGCDYVISCTNGKCNVTMADNMEWDNEDFNAKQNVISKWNNRASL